MALYNHRGSAEIEQFRNDKMGLYLASVAKTVFWLKKP
jgi:hypothetical protein